VTHGHFLLILFMPSANQISSACGVAKEISTVVQWFIRLLPRRALLVHAGVQFQTASQNGSDSDCQERDLRLQMRARVRPSGP
jgi:hypothetical protein